MTSSIKKVWEQAKKNINGYFALLFLFSILFSSNVTAQQESSTALTEPDSALTEESSGPSISNMKKTGSAMTEEVKKIKERQEREELIGYIIMILGFGAVMFLAWFLTVQAKKMQEKKDAIKRKYLEAKVANQAKSGHRSSTHNRSKRK